MCAVDTTYADRYKRSRQAAIKRFANLVRCAASKPEVQEALAELDATNAALAGNMPNTLAQLYLALREYSQLLGLNNLEAPQADAPTTTTPAPSPPEQTASDSVPGAGQPT